MTQLLKNFHVSSTNPEGFVLYRKGDSALFIQERNSHGELVLTLNAHDPAVVLKPIHAVPFEAYLKKDFQAAHKPDAAPDLVQKIVQDFGMPIDQFRQQMRTVGCGTNVYLALDDGIYQLAVQRTAPQKTPEGIVNAGAYSRAAGGATGPINESTVREMIEECNIFVRKDDGTILSLDIIPPHADVSDRYIESLLAEKHTRISQILSQVHSYEGTIQTARYDATRLAIPSLTENVIQVVDSTPSVLSSKVVVDDPKNGDLGGVDDIILVRIPGFRSSQIIVGDGETDLENKLLGRTWLVKPGQEYQDALKEGRMKFSAAPAKVISHTPQVMNEIHRTLGIK